MKIYRATEAAKRQLGAQIAALRAAGRTLPQIAAALDISLRTAERYAQRFEIPRPDAPMRRVTVYEVGP